MLLCVCVFLGCLDESKNNNSKLMVFDNLKVTTRCGYGNDTVYRDSVLVVSVNITNTDVTSGKISVQFFLDDIVEDEKQVFLNASEQKTIVFTNLKPSYTQFPLQELDLNTTGIHTVHVGPLSTNITVFPPPLTVDIQSVEWKMTNDYWIPWISLRVHNPTKTYFYLGGSFAVVTDEGSFEGSIESWNLLKESEEPFGYYRFPHNNTAEVVISCYELQSTNDQGSDILLQGIRIYEGFPWLDQTGGIIGEIFF